MGGRSSVKLKRGKQVINSAPWLFWGAHGNRRVKKYGFKAQLLSAVLVGALSLMLAQPALACIEGVKSELEKLYCEVVAKGEGQGLPSFDDFRRNPAATQQLLLKRPAKRAGLVMPEISKPAKPKTQHGAHTSGRPAKVAGPSALTRSAKPIVPSSLKGCIVTASQIQCGNTRYRLLDNRSNRALNKSALTPQNALKLPTVPDYRSNLELHNYLQKAYAVYLNKMDAIGLAGATLSYSKFYYIFDDTQQQGQDFVKRFAMMYGFLQKDKSTMAVAKQHKGKKPPALSSCDVIGGDFVTCDSRGYNWVFSL